jgi:predicted lipoprotein
MLKRIALALAVASGFAWPVSAVDADSANAIVADAIEKVVRQNDFILYSQLNQLTKDLDALCTSPAAESLENARDAYTSTVADWSKVEMIRFGPVTENNRLEKILYWPDRKSIGLKQVQQVLATKDHTVLAVGTLASKSVALQGLGALEFVLFGTGSEALADGDAFRCGYARAIGQNIYDNVEAMRADWSREFEQVWSSPGPDNPHYRTADESLTEVLNTLIHGLEMVRDVRIGGFLGDQPDEDKPKQAIYWRSGATFLSIRNNVEMLHQLFTDAGVERLLPDNSKWIAQSIEFEFKNAEDALWLSGPVDEILSKPDKRAKLAYAVIVTSSLTDLIADRLTAELGLTAGFSSLDGD